MMFLDVWRVMDGARIAAVCATRGEAAAWIARQPGDDQERANAMNDQGVLMDYVNEILLGVPDGLDEFEFLRRCIEDVRGGYENEVVAAFRIYVAKGRHKRAAAVRS